MEARCLTIDWDRTQVLQHFANRGTDKKSDWESSRRHQSIFRWRDFLRPEFPRPVRIPRTAILTILERQSRRENHFALYARDPAGPVLLHRRTSLTQRGRHFWVSIPASVPIRGPSSCSILGKQSSRRAANKVWRHRCTCLMNKPAENAISSAVYKTKKLWLIWGKVVRIRTSSVILLHI